MKLVCNKFNDFCINVGPSLSEKIPKQDILPVSLMKYKAIYSFYLEPVTEIEVKKLISSLKLATPGYDIFCSSLPKWSPESFSEPLCYICNMSLQEGVFPDEMKIANVITLYKCDDPQLFNDYRPVSSLCSLSKVLEKIVIFQRPLILLVMVFCLKSYRCMELEGMHYHGFRITWTIGNNLHHLMGLNQI